MPIPSALKKGLIIACCLSLILVTGVMAAWWYLPTHIEQRILPQILEQVGITRANCPVRRAGLFGADLGPLRIGEKNARPLTIDSIQLDYSPLGLYRKRIRSVRLTGLDMFCTIDQRGFKIHGLEPIINHFSQKDARKSDLANQPLAVPVHIKRLALSHSTFHLTRNQKKIHIPFSISIYSPMESANVYNSQLTALILGEEIQIDGQVNLDAPHLSLNLESKPLALGRLFDLLDINESISGNARARLKGQLKAVLSPPGISGVTLEAIFEKLNLVVGNIRLASLPDGSQKNTRPNFKAKQLETHRWQVSVKNIRLFGPTGPELRLSTIDTRIHRKSNQVFLVDGQLGGVVSPFYLGGSTSLALKEPLFMDTAFSGQGNTNGTWQMAVKTRPSDQPHKPVSMMVNGVDFSSPPLIYSTEASGNKTSATAQISVKIPRAEITTKMAKLGSGQINLTADLTANLSEKPLRPRFKLSLKSATTKGRITSTPNQKPITLEIPHLGITTSGQVNPVEIDANLNFSGMKIASPEHNFEIKRINANLPLQWPAPQKGKNGRVILGSTRYESWDLGTTVIQLTQNRQGYFIRGDHTNPILPMLTTHFSGEALLYPPEKPSIRLHLNAKRTSNAANIDLGRFSAKAKGIAANGDFRIKGEFRATEQGTHGNLCLKIDRGKVDIPASEMALNGLQLQLCLPKMPKIQSAPQQQIVFNELTMGQIKVHQGSFDYQIESPKRIFLEKGKFRWSSGSVRVGAMRFSPEEEDFDIRLDCDRLNLAEILNQLGVAEAEGSGTVNGSVPVRFKNGKISFDDGFLYSTPGAGGKIRIRGTQGLTTGIPEGTIQFNQIDLAREALEDYDYEWAKLGLNTQNNELVMRLQFDGKPAKILPFEFRKELGGFVRVNTDGGGSKFQGISLDVNFRIPLDDLMQYTDVLQHLE